MDKIRSMRERGIKDDSWYFDLSNWASVGSFPKWGKLRKRYVSGREKRVLFGQVEFKMSIRHKRGEPSRLLGI